MIVDRDVHILDVPAGMRRRAGLTCVVELPVTMGRDVKLSIWRRDRLVAASPDSNVVALLPHPVEMLTDSA